MRVLLVHNHYQQPGGEDRVFAAEAALLTAHGHDVRQLAFDNDAIPARRAALQSARLAGETIWSPDGFARVRAAARAFRPDVAHFHNTFPLISPAGYYAARAEGVPIVQTLHNYRLFCVDGVFYRDGHVCEDCLHKPIPLPGVIHKCYRDSRAASGVTAAMLATHRALRTWTRAIDRYIVLTEFSRAKFVQGGLPPDKLMVKPNFVSPDPGIGAGRGGYALFVGRLSPEKGIEILLRAWRQLGGRIPLKIIGDGPLASIVADAAREIPGVEWLAQLPPPAVADAMHAATALIFPSDWFETFGLVIVEAFACGTPVIAPNFGTMGEIIRDGETGLHYRPGDADHLATTVKNAFARLPILQAMRATARTEYEARYTAEKNYHRLLEIYASIT